MSKVCSVSDCDGTYHAKGLCKKHYHRQRYKADPASARARTVKYLKNHPEQRIISSAKYNAKQRGIHFDLTKEDIYIPTHCPILGIELNIESNVGEGKQGPKSGPQAGNSPSIDRIDSSKGYVKDNIQIISWRANHIKSDASFEEIEKLYNYMKP